MYLVKVATNLTKAIANRRVKKAELKNERAIKKLRSAKKGMDETQFNLQSTQAEVLIHLTKLNDVQKDISEKAKLNGVKQEKLAALLEDIEA